MYTSTINRLLSRMGLTERHRQRHQCDEGFFDVIDTETKAYWLGFIAADGNVHRVTLSIGLAPVDEAHLHTFTVDIGGTQQVETRLKVDGRYVSRVRVNSVPLVAALARHGIVPHKSLTLEWPTLPVAMERHFLRGYVDGDGSWHVRPSRVGRPTWAVSLVGTETFLRRAMAVLIRDCALRPVTIGPASKQSVGVMRFYYGGNQQVARIYRYLYDGATVFLPRKEAKAREAAAEAGRTLAGWQSHPEGCSDCGSTRRRYYARGLCSVCYQRRWEAARKAS